MQLPREYMKRSEMIKTLVETHGSYDLWEQQCEYMLRIIESVGMKPPRLDEETCQAIMSIYIGGCSFNQWDEDTAKDTKVTEALQRRAKARETRVIKAKERRSKV
jgi:hypothetical protein